MEVISCSQNGKSEHERPKSASYLVQSIGNFTQPSLNTVPPIIPFPTTKDIAVHTLLVHESVLSEFRRVVVQQIAKGINCFGNGRCEELFVLREIL